MVGTVICGVYCLFLFFWHLIFVSFLKARSGFSVWEFVVCSLFSHPFSLTPALFLFQLCFSLSDQVYVVSFCFFSLLFISQPDPKGCNTDGE